MEIDERLKKGNIENLSKAELINLVKELKETKDLQEDFLLNISHDLRNPINVILSVLQCLKYENNTESLETIEKRKEYGNILRRNSLKIVKLIDNLIDTSKLQKNYYTLKKYNVEVIGMIENTVNSVEQYAEQKGIRIIFDTNEEECVCAVDPVAIDRIVMNLLSNAIKFSPRDSEILVNINVNDKDISLSVKDQGIGIPKKDQKLIFNRFIQSIQGKKNEYSGSGIGLDLVTYLTKAHDGTILLNSEEGVGSEFIVKIPLSILENKDRDYEIESRSKVEQLEVEFSDIYL